MAIRAKPQDTEAVTTTEETTPIGDDHPTDVMTEESRAHKNAGEEIRGIVETIVKTMIEDAAAHLVTRNLSTIDAEAAEVVLSNGGSITKRKMKETSNGESAIRSRNKMKSLLRKISRTSGSQEN